MTRRPLPPPGRTHVLGILNVTPDSFSDGGRHFAPRDAVAAGVELVAQGAHMLDVGAVSTRPGSDPVPADVEWQRLASVLSDLRREVDVPLSLDTTSARVLDAALEVGVDLLNDTSALRDDGALAPLVADAGLPVVLMHRRGLPASMQDAVHYDDPVGEVLAELEAFVAAAVEAGIPRERILLDPGIGFGKRLDHNVALLSALDRLGALGHRTVLGCSRKSFLGQLTGAEVGDREHATTVTTVLAAQAGMDFVRVHEARAAADALAVLRAVSVASPSPPR